MSKSRWSPAFSLAACALVLWLLQAFGLGFVRVSGASMKPTFHDGQVLFINKVAYGLQWPIIERYLWIWKAPVLGDLVVLQRPDAQRWVVKRVAALGGDQLRVENHQLKLARVSVDLTPAQEYWLAACSQVPLGACFVLGDNHTQSLDSRDWGFVALSDIVGSPVF